MTERKSLEEILAECTEDLLADREPQLGEAVATLGAEERAQLMESLVLVRRLKAAYRDAPPPREEFLRRLDGYVREEIVRLAPDPEWADRDAVGPAAEISGVGLRRTLGYRMLHWCGVFLRSFTPTDAVGRWRLATAILLVVICAVQLLLYRHIRQLEHQNNTLVVRFERLRGDEMYPLSLPRIEGGTSTIRGKVTPGEATLSELIASAEFRQKVELRAQELEKEISTKTGEERRCAEAVLRELRALLKR